MLLQTIWNKVLLFHRGLLSYRDWFYLLSLLAPFFVCTIALKLSSIFIACPGCFEALPYLIASDVFFSLGYGLLWIGVFAAARSGPLRWVAVSLFHATTILVVAITISAHQYFRIFGTTLSYDTIVLELPRIVELMQYGFFDEVSPLAWVLLGTALFYAAFGPWLLIRFVRRWRGWVDRLPPIVPAPRRSFLGPLGLCLLALIFGSLSLLIGPSPVDAWEKETFWKGLSESFSTSFVRHPFVNVAATWVERINSEELAAVAAEPPPPASLLPTTSGSEQRNVVLVILESTRAQSVTPYNEDLDTTPFMHELAKRSLVAEQAYTVVPSTSKANVASICGITPSPAEPIFGAIREAKPGGIPVPCLADLLKDHDYNTVFFTSASKDFENYEDLVENLGYEEFYPVESMDKEGFEEVNYLDSSGGGNREDNIMLNPSEAWLEKHNDKPFLATYLTATPHHQYIVPKRYGEEKFSEDEQLNRYLNTLRYQDFFLKNLFDQYKKLGLYENTVFLLFGDHGEAFGEHGLKTHGNVIYEEGVRIPLIVHDPKRSDNGDRIKDPVNQLDILPTVADLLGYQIEGGAYEGSSLLRPLPKERTLMFSCQLEGRCAASLKDNEKYIHHYGDKPDEVFDLTRDPLEKTNLAEDGGKDLQERRNELLAWQSRIAAFYRDLQGQ